MIREQYITEYAIDTARFMAGSAQMDRRLDELARSSDKADRELAQLARQGRKAGSELRNAGGGAGKLSSTLGGLKGIIASLGASIGFAVLARGIASAAGRSAEARTQLTALVGIGDDVADEWQKASIRIGAAVGVLPTEIQEALFVVASAGARGAEALDIVERSAKASAIGLGETKDTARLVTAAIQAYAAEGLTAADATDILVATIRAGNLEAASLSGSLGRVIGTAAKVGISFDEVGGFIATFTRLGVNAEEAVTALRGVISTILLPTREAEDSLAAVGLTFRDLRSQIEEKGLARTLVDLVKIFEGNDEALAKIIPNVRALSGVLGTAGVQATKFEEIERQVKESTGELDIAFAKLGEDPVHAWEQLKAAIEGVALAIGDRTAPAFTGLVQILSIVASDLAKVITGSREEDELLSRLTPKVDDLARAEGELGEKRSAMALAQDDLFEAEKRLAAARENLALQRMLGIEESQRVQKAKTAVDQWSVAVEEAGRRLDSARVSIRATSEAIDDLGGTGGAGDAVARDAAAIEKELGNLRDRIDIDKREKKFSIEWKAHLEKEEFIAELEELRIFVNEPLARNVVAVKPAGEGDVVLPLPSTEDLERFGELTEEELRDAAAVFREGLADAAMIFGDLLAEVLSGEGGDFADILSRAARGAGAQLGSMIDQALGGSGALGSIIGGLAEGAVSGHRTGESILGGAQYGAMIGTAIAPGIGTLIGFAAGAVVGLIADGLRDVEQGFGQIIMDADGLRPLVHEGAGAMGELVSEALAGIAQTATALIEGAGGTIVSIASDFALIVRESGQVGATIAGLKQDFDTVEEAIEALIVGLVRSAEVVGAGPTVAAALANFSAETVEELDRTLAAAALLDGLSVDEFVAPVADKLREIFDAVRVLIAQGAGDAALTAAAPMAVDTLATAYGQLMGVEEDAAAAAEAHFYALKAQVAVTIANLMALDAENQARAAEVQSRGTSARSMVDAAEILALSSAAGSQAIAGLGETVVGVAEASAAASAAIREAIAALEALDFGEGALAQARQAAGRATQGAARAERERAEAAREQALFELAVLEARRDGNDALAEELERRRALEDTLARLAESLTAEELARAREALEAAAAAEAARDLAAHLRELQDAARGVHDTIGGILDEIGDLAAGPTGEPASAARLADLEERLRDGIEDVYRQIDQAYADGNDDLGRSLEATLAGMFDRLEQLAEDREGILRRAGLEGLAGLGSAAARLALEAEASAAAIQYLLDHLDELGLTAEQVADAVQQGILPQLLAMAEAEARRVGDIERANELAERRERLERALALLQLANLEAQLFLAGAMTPELAHLIAQIRRDLEAMPPAPDLTPDTGDETTGADIGPPVKPRDVLDLAQALGASAARWIAEADDMRAALDELAEGVRNGSITMEQAAAVLEHAGGNAFRSLAGDLLGFVDRYYGESVEGEELRRAHLQISHTLEMAELRIRFELVRQLGILTAQQLRQIEGLLDFAETHEPDWDALLSGVSGAGDAAGDTAAAAASLAQQLKSLKDELASLLDAAEDATLGPLERQLNAIYDNFARIGALLVTTNAAAEDWQRAQAAMAEQLRQFWKGAFSEAGDLLERIRGDRRSPTERYRAAQAEFEALQLPADLSSLNPDDIADMVAKARRAYEAGVAQFGEGYAQSSQARQIEAFLEQLQGLAPTEEDLLLLAIEHLEEQVGIRLDTVAGHAASIADALTAEESLASTLQDIADQLGDEGLAAILNGLAAGLLNGTLTVQSPALLVGLDAVRDGLAADSPLYNQLSELIDGTIAGLGAEGLGGLLQAIAGDLGPEGGLAAELSAIAGELIDGSLSIDDEGLLERLKAIRDGLGDSPLADLLDSVINGLEGELDVHDPRSTVWFEDNLRRQIADTRLRLGPNQPITNRLDSLKTRLSAGGPLANRLDGLKAQLGVGQPITNRLDLLRGLLGVNQPISNRLDQIRTLLGTGQPVTNRLDGVRTLLGVGQPVTNRLDQIRGILESIRDGGVGQVANRQSASFGSGGTGDFTPITGRLDEMLLRMNGPALLAEIKGLRADLARGGSLITAGGIGR